MPTPSEETTPSLDLFLDLRDSLQTARSGHGGHEVCEALTSSLDRAIADLVTPLPDDVAIVAVGGYGRVELSPFSDVDLMLLHSVDDPADLASALFRPLWDAKLRVGHSVRTVKEASSAAKERFDTQTTLLTSRLITGDEDLFRRLMDEVTAVTRARPLRRHLVLEEQERRRETPYLLMATNVKTGRGGLRTLQGFEWEQRREELIGRFSIDSRPEEAVAGEWLLRIRNALHAIAGRAHDVFSPDLRDGVGRWLGIDELEAARGLVDAMQTVDSLATRRWPEVVDERQKRVWARRPRAPRRVAEIEPSDIDDFVLLLETGERGRLEFERSWDEGLLDRVIPEWEVVRALPQLAPFHEHPVSAHLWRTVDEMHRLIDEDGHYGRVAGEIDSRRVLLLAAFLHDMGKGHGGDHSVVGALIARSFCERMAIAADEAALIEGAVRLHLLLPTTATRRDLDDPAVIDEISQEIGDLRLLQVLYLLTVADSRATGPTMWGDWRAKLVQSLFARCAARFGGDRPAHPGASREEILAAAGSGRSAVVEEHVDRMPSDYLRSASVADVLWHIELVEGLEGASIVGVRYERPVETAVVVGRSRPGFRRQVAESFAANGIDVLEARLFSRDDGMIVDTFRVRDDRTGGVVEPERWDSLRLDVEAGLLGQLDTGSKVAARAAAYGEVGGDEPAVRGSIDSASGDLVMTIKCADRIGRLAEIISVLNDCGLDIRLAKIDSREGEVVDTFHVNADPARGEADVIEALENRIASAIAP